MNPKLAYEEFITFSTNKFSTRCFPQDVHWSMINLKCIYPHVRSDNLDELKILEDNNSIPSYRSINTSCDNEKKKEKRKYTSAIIYFVLLRLGTVRLRTESAQSGGLVSSEPILPFLKYISYIIRINGEWDKQKTKFQTNQTTTSKWRGEEGALSIYDKEACIDLTAINTSKERMQRCLKILPCRSKGKPRK